jgi:hypothetical protein
MSEAPGAERNREQDLRSSLDRKFWSAMALYAILAAVVWLTLGEGTTIVFGKPVAIRAIPLFVIGMFVFRTVMAREADKIRRKRQEQL